MKHCADCRLDPFILFLLTERKDVMRSVLMPAVEYVVCGNPLEYTSTNTNCVPAYKIYVY